MINFFSNPTVRTIVLAKEIYDRKQAGEFLNEMAREKGYTFVHVSRLYNWYKKIYKKGKGAK